MLERFWKELKIEWSIHYERNSTRQWWIDLTKNTPFEPWVRKELHGFHFFNKPFNIWYRHDNMGQRVSRAFHLGFYTGILNAIMLVHFDNIHKGYTHREKIWRPGVMHKAALGMSMGFMQWGAFAVGTTLCSHVRGTDDAMDYYFGGLCTAAVTGWLGNGRVPRYTYAVFVLFPILMSTMKLMRYMNNWDSERYGIIPGALFSGPQSLSYKDMDELYGIKDENRPIEKILKYSNEHDTDYVWLKPRSDVTRNDTFVNPNVQ